MCVYVNCVVCVYVDRLINIMYLPFYFTGSVAKAEMEHIQQAMPSISQVLRKLHTNPNNSKLSTVKNGVLHYTPGALHHTGY